MSCVVKTPNFKMFYYKNEGCYWTENLQNEMYLGCSITKESWKLKGSAILHFWNIYDVTWKQRIGIRAILPPLVHQNIFQFSTYIFLADITAEMLKLCRVTKAKVFFLVPVYVFNFNLFEFSSAILWKGLLVKLVRIHNTTVAHRGHAAILKVAPILNIFLQTIKTCCIIKILAAVAFNVLQIEKNS